MLSIKTIALTGGACSGKTTFLNKLKSHGEEFCGYRMLFVPEVATMFSNHGLSFYDGEVVYQRAILSTQLALQDSYLRYARDLDRDVCIVCDRGSLDGAAYCGQEAFETLCEEIGISREEQLNVYDNVLYLVSAAVGASEHYGIESNDTRRESLDEAVELEKATFECWKDHPSIVVIGNENGKTFDEKMNQAFDALVDMLKQ